MVLETWSNFWFSKGSSVHLGGVRVLTFVLLYLMARKSSSPWVRVGSWLEVRSNVPVFWQPIALFRILPAFSSERIGNLVTITWKVSLAAAVVGLLSPIPQIVAAVLSLFVLGFQNNFGKIHHGTALIPFVLATMACAPADSLMTWPVFEIVSNKVGYHWPIQMVRVLIALCWFGAGISKLRHGGLRWIFSKNLSTLLHMHTLDYYFAPPPSTVLTEFLAKRPILCSMLAGYSVVLELLFPCALLSPQLALMIVPQSLLLILGFALFQGPLFLPLFMLTAIYWFPFSNFS